ncbi:MAG TPA: DUF2809 domain-containing protein [Ruminococcus sp.]|nr:DUF2809 domain-containing protein [Ruminococcus sp.]
MKRRVRISMTAASAILFVIELMIALFATGFLRNHIGDLLIVTLLYTLWRMVFPEQPKYGLLIPTAILLFAFGIELLQLWGFCDKMHITDPVLRICIGTGYSELDFLCYLIGALPGYAAEFLLRRRRKALSL